MLGAARRSRGLMRWRTATPDRLVFLITVAGAACWGRAAWAALFVFLAPGATARCRSPRAGGADALRRVPDSTSTEFSEAPFRSARGPSGHSVAPLLYGWPLLLVSSSFGGYTGEGRVPADCARGLAPREARIAVFSSVGGLGCHGNLQLFARRRDRRVPRRTVIAHRHMGTCSRKKG